MSQHTWTRSRRSVLAAVAAAGLAAATLSTAGGAAAAPPAHVSAAEFRDGAYVVLFSQDPSATYTGGVPGYAATKAPQGRSFTHGRGAVQRYEAYLENRQRETLATVGAQPLYTYTTAVNASAVVLTSDQAARLARQKGVLAVTPDEARTVDTVTSPEFLGLEGAGGDVWQQVGGSDQAGSGTVVGVIDTGYWP